MNMVAPRRRQFLPEPQPYRWTREEFQRLGDLGWFEGRRAIFIHGDIIEEGPMNPLHATGITDVTRMLFRRFGDEFVIRVQAPLNVGTDNDPLPDFAIIRGLSADYVERHPDRADWVIEVADSSLKFDLSVKAKLYATASIPEYWVLDVLNRQLHVLHSPNDEGYADISILESNGRLGPLLAPDSIVSVAELLPIT